MGEVVGSDISFLLPRKLDPYLWANKVEYGPASGKIAAWESVPTMSVPTHKDPIYIRNMNFALIIVGIFYPPLARYGGR